VRFILVARSYTDEHAKKTRVFAKFFTFSSSSECHQ
jgi:hypothetical protein